jgi:Na+-driven multidrug efflux pump
MTERELIFIAILLVNLVLMFFAFKLINKLSDEGKISKRTKTYLMVISLIIPIIGWMRVNYESKKF